MFQEELIRANEPRAANEDRSEPPEPSHRKEEEHDIETETLDAVTEPGLHEETPSWNDVPGEKLDSENTEDPMTRALDRKELAGQRAELAREKARSSRDISSEIFPVAAPGRSGVVRTAAVVVASGQREGRMGASPFGMSSTGLSSASNDPTGNRDALSVEERLNALLHDVRNPRTFVASAPRLEKTVPALQKAPEAAPRDAVTRPVNTKDILFDTARPILENKPEEIQGPTANRTANRPSEGVEAGKTETTKTSETRRETVKSSATARNDVTTQSELASREAKTASLQAQAGGKDRRLEVMKETVASLSAKGKGSLSGVEGVPFGAQSATGTSSALAGQALARSAVVSRIPEQLGQMIEQGQNRLELRLDPPHLGSLNITISRQADHVAVRMVVQTQQAGDALKSMQPEMLQRLGLEGHDAVELSVHVDTGSGERDGGYAWHEDAEHLERVAAPVKTAGGHPTKTRNVSGPNGGGLHWVA